MHLIMTLISQTMTINLVLSKVARYNCHHHHLCNVYSLANVGNTKYRLFSSRTITICIYGEVLWYRVTIYVCQHVCLGSHHHLSQDTLIVVNLYQTPRTQLTTVAVTVLKTWFQYFLSLASKFH